jgi:hypothetical protein
MKKTYFFPLLFVLAVTFGVNAQAKGKISLSFGGSVPIGDFAKSDYNDSTSGFAQTDAFASIEGIYPLKKNLGLLGIIGFGRNPIDADALVQGLGEEIANSTGQTVSISVEVGSWEVLSIMGGAILTAPVDEKISLNIKGAAGLMSATSPELKATVTIPGTGSFEVSQTSAKSPALCFLIGGGAGYKLSNKWEMQLNVDYMRGTPELEIQDSDGNTSKSKQTISAIGIKAGIGFIL